MFVYVIVCNETLKIYVGQHKGTDLQKYLSQKFSHATHGEATGSCLYRAMRKHPKATWSIHPLVSDLQTREEVDAWERYYIKVLNAQHREVGYNLGPGGESAPIGNANGKGNKGNHYPKSKEFRQQVSQKLKGRKIPEDVVRKSAETRRGKQHNITSEGRVRMAVMKGKTHLPATLIKMAKAQTGKHHSEVSKQKMRKPKSVEAVQHMNEAWKTRIRKQCPHGSSVRKCRLCARARYKKWYWSHKP